MPAQSFNPAIQAESPVGQGCRTSTEVVRWERTSDSDRTVVEYTPRVHSTCRTLVDIGHRHLMQPQTNQAQQRRSQQVSGFYSYLAPLLPPSKLSSSLENHVSARDLFVVSRLLNIREKRAGDVSSLQHCAKALGMGGRVFIGGWKLVKIERKQRLRPWRIRHCAHCRALR